MKNVINVKVESAEVFKSLANKSLIDPYATVKKLPKDDDSDNGTPINSQLQARMNSNTSLRTNKEGFMRREVKQKKANYTGRSINTIRQESTGGSQDGSSKNMQETKMPGWITLEHGLFTKEPERDKQRSQYELQQKLIENNRQIKKVQAKLGFNHKIQIENSIDFENYTQDRGLKSQGRFKSIDYSQSLFFQQTQQNQAAFVANQQLESQRNEFQQRQQQFSKNMSMSLGRFKINLDKTICRQEFQMQQPKSVGTSVSDYKLPTTSQTQKSPEKQQQLEISLKQTRLSDKFANSVRHTSGLRTGTTTNVKFDEASERLAVPSKKAPVSRSQSFDGGNLRRQFRSIPVQSPSVRALIGSNKDLTTNYSSHKKIPQKEDKEKTFFQNKAARQKNEPKPLQPMDKIFPDLSCRLDANKISQNKQKKQKQLDFSNFAAKRGNMTETLQKRINEKVSYLEENLDLHFKAKPKNEVPIQTFQVQTGRPVKRPVTQNTDYYIKKFESPDKQEQGAEYSSLGLPNQVRQQMSRHQNIRINRKELLNQQNDNSLLSKTFDSKDKLGVSSENAKKSLVLQKRIGQLVTNDKNKASQFNYSMTRKPVATKLESWPEQSKFLQVQELTESTPDKEVQHDEDGALKLLKKGKLKRWFLNATDREKEKLILSRKNDGGKALSEKQKQLEQEFRRLEKMHSQGIVSDQELAEHQKKIEEHIRKRSNDCLVRDINKLRNELEEMNKLCKTKGFNLRENDPAQVLKKSQVFENATIKPVKVYEWEAPQALTLMKDFNERQDERIKTRQHISLRKQQKECDEDDEKMQDVAYLMRRMIATDGDAAAAAKYDKPESTLYEDVSEISRNDFDQFMEEVKEMVVTDERFLNDSQIRNGDYKEWFDMQEEIEIQKSIKSTEDLVNYICAKLLKELENKKKNNKYRELAQKSMINKLMTKIKEQIGAEHLMLSKFLEQQKMNKKLLKEQKETILEKWANNIVTRHEANKMRHILWKDFKKRKNDIMDESDTSEMSEKQEDFDLEQKVGSQVMFQLKQNKFRKILKETSGHGAELYFSQDSDFIYKQSMLKKGEPILPLTAKIQNGVLDLQDYTLSIGQCISLTKVLEVGREGYLRELRLDNCGVDDGELAQLLRGLATQRNFKVFSYKQNQFFEKSLEALRPILTKQQPNHLEELSLTSLRTHPIIVEKLCDMILEEAYNLQALKLQAMQLTGPALKTISELMRCSIWLETLDLSCNNLEMQHWANFFEILQNNRTLINLSLSNNMLLSWKEQQEKGDLSLIILSKSSKFQLIREYVQLRLAEQVEQANKAKYESAPMRIARCFGKFIRHNKCLQYLDMEYTGLSHKIICDLIPQLRRAKSLLSIHLGCNPGIDDHLRGVILRKLHCKYKPKLSTVVEIQKPTVLSPRSDKLYHQEAVTLAQIRAKARQYVLENVENINITKPLSLTRILGHKTELPGSGQWQLLSEQPKEYCWVRDLHRYTIFLWTPTMGLFHDINGIQLDEQQKQSIVQQLKTFASKTKLHDIFEASPLEEPVAESNIGQKPPVLFAQSNQWHGKEMMPLLSFLKLWVKKYPNFESQAEKEVEKEKKELFKRLSAEKHQLGEPFKEEQKKEIVTKMKEELVKKMQENHLIRISDQWKSVIKSYNRYPNPFYINDELVTHPTQTYILPLFLKPGRHHFFVANTDKKVYYSRHLVQCRAHPIPTFVKELGEKKNVREFKFEVSVFADWKKDDRMSIKQAIDHDRKLWKVNKFVKDEDELNNILGLIFENWEILNAIYHSLISYGSYPFISNYEFEKFARVARFCDEDFPMHHIDVFFVAANVEDEDLPEISDTALCRFQFFELLVRIARGKFLESQIEDHIDKAFGRLLKNFVLPAFETIPHWQRFRDQKIWNLNVHDCMDFNRKNLQYLYDRQIGLQSIKERVYMNKVSATSLFVENEEIRLSKKLASAAFGMSKMTVIEETSQRWQYNNIKFVEFLEMICRVAVMKFEGTPMEKSWSLEFRIFMIIEHLLTAQGLTASKPGQVEQTESESDCDY